MEFVEMETRWRRNKKELRWRLLVMFAIFLAFLDTKDADAAKDENFTTLVIDANTTAFIGNLTYDLETTEIPKPQSPNQEIISTTEVTRATSTRNAATISYLSGGGGVGTWQEIAIGKKVNPLPIAASATSTENQILTWFAIFFMSLVIFRQTCY